MSCMTLPADESIDIEDLLEDFYWALEAYETHQNALSILDSAVADPATPEPARHLWKGKRGLYVRRFQWIADKLLVIVNKFIIAGRRSNLQIDPLEKFLSCISYRPYNEVPTVPLTDKDTQRAIDCAEQIRASQQVGTSPHPPTITSPSVETIVASLTDRERDLLRAARRLSATEAFPKRAKEIAKDVDPQLGPDNYKHQFSSLVKKSFLGRAPRRAGYFLAVLGEKCVEFLESHP